MNEGRPRKGPPFFVTGGLRSLSGEGGLQKPDTLLRFVRPAIDQAARRNVAIGFGRRCAAGTGSQRRGADPDQVSGLSARTKNDSSPL